MSPPAPDEMPADLRHAQRVRLMIIGGVVALVVGLHIAGQEALALPLSSLAWVVFLFGTLRPTSRLFGPVITHGGSDKLLFTIDDGPDPETTPQLLDLLRAHDIKATFFLIGERAKNYPEIVRQIVAEGHEIGNHTQTHPQALFWCLGPQRLWKEIGDCQKLLTDVAGSAPIWFRSPVGHTNPFIQPILQTLGLRRMAWTARGYDAVRRDVESIVRDIAADMKPGGIVLLHDATTVAAQVLEGLLRSAKDKGLITSPSQL